MKYKVHVALFLVTLFYAILFSFAGQIMPDYLDPGIFVWMRIVVAALLFYGLAKLKKKSLKIDWKKDGKEIEIDSRTSDAIALAVRFACNIFTYEFVLGSAGIVLDDEDDEENAFVEEDVDLDELTKDPVETFTLDDLKLKMQEAIENEDYEQASKIRDEIKRRNSN